MSRYWAGRHEALCCSCGTLRTVSPKFSGAHPDIDSRTNANGWRALSMLKCVTCGTMTRHADLLDPGEPRRDAADAPESTPYTLAARLLKLESAGVELEWTDADEPVTLHRFPSDDEGPEWARLVIARARSCAEVLGAVEQAQQLIRDADWNRCPPGYGWDGERYRWTVWESGVRSIYLHAVSCREGSPAAVEAERLIDRHHAGA